MRMLRTADWKLVRHYHANQLDELYDLKNDPGETNNLYSGSAHAHTRALLQERLERSMRAIKDPILQFRAATTGK